MTFSSQTKRSARNSVMRMMDVGHQPIADRNSVRTAEGIRIPVSGSASRLVSRKCFGKVPKYM